MKKGYLILENGMAFEGRRFGAAGDAVGALAYATGMCSYIETLTDPCHFGQIVMQTFPLIGNYGMIERDFIGEGGALGYIVREACDAPSNFRAQYSLAEYLSARGIPGLMGVETRDVVHALRAYGAMNAMIADAVPDDLSALRAHRPQNALQSTGRRARATLPATGEERHCVAMIGYGAEASLARALCALGCRVELFPYGARAEEVLAIDPDGVALSDGAGDPADNPACIDVIRALAGVKPMLAVGLGHQLLARAMGMKTRRLSIPHRGENIPVRDEATGRCFITRQNHADAVVCETGARYINVSDGSCEGIDYADICVIAIQFRPPEHTDPGDADAPLNRFISHMGGN